MKSRKISKVVFAREHAMGEIMVRQPLPSQKVDYLDPFVLLHHAENDVPEDLNLRHSGVGPHPHRGFAPVTFVFEGGIYHQDSRGNTGTVFTGGVQWMHAGMGIIHSERPAISGHQEFIQMWINSPAKHKMDQPAYYPLTAENTPQVWSDDKKIRLSAVSGNILGTKGPVPTLSPINSAMIWGEKTGKVFIPFEASHNAFIYVLTGKVKIGDQEVSAQNMIVLDHDGEGVQLEILEGTKVLFMSGEPIGEAIIAQGPFVVNHEIQITEAYRDYRMGKMGILIEE